MTWLHLRLAPKKDAAKIFDKPLSRDKKLNDDILDLDPDDDHVTMFYP